MQPKNQKTKIMNLKVQIKKSKNRKSRRSEIQISKRDADKKSKDGNPLKGATKVTNRSSKVRTEGLSKKGLAFGGPICRHDHKA